MTLNVQQLQKRSFKVLLASLALFLAASVQAMTWSDTFIGYRYGTDFTEPGVPDKVKKNILQLGHVSGYSLGQHFFNLDVLRSDHNDPKKDSHSGATEGYLVYRHQLFLGKVFERSLAFGPVKEVALTTGIELNYKNTEFANRKRMLEVGPTLKFDVPGYLDVSLLYAYEWNHCGVSSCATENIDFDPHYLLHAVWGIPFQLGGVPLKFQGFAMYKTDKGKDYFKADTSEETQIRTSLMVDVGQLTFGSKNTLMIGPGYEYWRHKYGSHGKPGTHTSAPTLHVEWHF
ncbi:hypothetical protein ACIKP7_02655 [Pseudomonas caricapapayae]|uniref:Uncharacterized protein n=1 Tax=Pseudomonas caricapapayae TaxID=46678 RepID=A0ACC7LPM0_9PSED